MPPANKGKSPANFFAVATAARQEVLPGVPSLAEFLPGYDASSWNGMVAPKAGNLVDRLRIGHVRPYAGYDLRPIPAGTVSSTQYDI